MKTAKQSSRSSGNSSAREKRDKQSKQSSSIVAPAATFELSVAQVNNLVRFLYTNGWISHEQHPDVHRMLDEMVKWLEQQGIKVSMDMPKL